MTTPRVQYAYADGSANTTRRTSTTYPDGKTITEDYGASGSDDDRLSRIHKIKDGGTTLAEYTYYGHANVLKAAYPVPAATLDFTYQGTSDDPYGGCLDRFGRVIQNPWIKSSAPIAGATYQYDRASNRTQMQPLGFTATNDLQRYSYDGLQRLTRSVRGSTNTLKAQEAWGLDATGNWGRYDVLDVDTPAQNLAQERSTNRANEITGITELYGAAWPTPAYDRAGNTTSFPQPLDPADAYAAKYDAWNRLVEVKEGSTVIATYAYDGLNRRTKQVASGITRHYYYSSQWQILEERTGTSPDSAPADRQFFWGVRYIDDLICRLKDSNRFFNYQDANWNTVAVTDDAGAVQQRFRYSAYGTPTRLDADGSLATGTDTFLWETLYAGYRFDAPTALLAVRYRVLQGRLGRWLTQDLVEYATGLNYYCYGFSNPVNIVDPLGLEGYPILFTGPFLGRFTPNSKPVPPAEEPDRASHVNSRCWRIAEQIIRQEIFTYNRGAHFYFGEPRVSNGTIIQTLGIRARSSCKNLSGMRNFVDAAVFHYSTLKGAKFGPHVGYVWEVKPLSKGGIRLGYDQLKRNYLDVFNSCCDVVAWEGKCNNLYYVYKPEYHPNCGYLFYNCTSGVVYYEWKKDKPKDQDPFPHVPIFGIPIRTSVPAGRGGVRGGGGGVGAGIGGGGWPIGERLF